MDQRDKDDNGQQFGRYRVRKVLGRGGMGVVYLAEDPKIGRDVAIKVIRTNPETPPELRAHLRKRFEVEAQSAGTLSHPNIATIYDIGEEDDAAYIAMEYVRGESLEDLLHSDRTLSFKEVSDLTTQLCRALDYAHAHGVIHRDIKPANILLTQEGRPKIVDFGVAKMGEALGGDETRLTQVGSIIGTPAYMSPEQVTGHDITAASDQFSLGVIVYEMLAGRVPFQGEGATTVMYRIVHEVPVGLSTFNKRFPGTIDEAVFQALAKSPEERYAECADFAKAVREALRSAPDEVEGEAEPLADATMLLGSAADLPADGTVLLTPPSDDTGGAQATVLMAPDSNLPDSAPPSFAQSGEPVVPTAATGRGRRLLLGAVATVALAIAAIVILRPDTPGAARPGGEVPAAEPAPETTEPLATDMPASMSDTSGVTTGESDPPPATVSSWWLSVGDNAGGAEIWLDGEDTGRTTPSEIELVGRRGDTVRLDLQREGLVLATTEIELGPFMPKRWSPGMLLAAEPPAVAENLFARSIQVRSRPRGAAVFLDGRDTGERTPASVTLEGEVGDRFRLEVRDQGRVLGDRQFVLGPNMPGEWDTASGAVTGSAVAEERPAAAAATRTFTITSEPPGARVRYDDEVLSATTPVEVRITDGRRHQLRIELDHHEAASWAFALGDLSDSQRQSGRLHFPLEPSTPPGSLRVVGQYAVTLRIDGRDRAVEPGTELELASGRREITIKAPEVFLDVSRTIDVPADGSYDLTLPAAMPVQVAAAPGNCRVSIDGRTVDTTPFSMTLSAGEHEFEFFWPTLGKTLRRTISVNRNGQRIFASAEEDHE